MAPTPRRTPVRLLLLLVVGAVLALGPARPAAAHAELLASDPADGAVLERSPADVALQFTEAVTVQPDGIRVLDTSGDRVDRGIAGADGATAVAPLKDDLPDGTYVIAWRVVSADGHPVRGSSTFSVGEPSAVPAGLVDDAFAGGSDGALDVVGAVLRWVAYVGALGAAGAVLVGAAIWRGGDRSPVGRAVTVSSSLGLVALVLQVPVAAMLATGEGISAATDGEALKLALGEGVGPAVLVTGIGLLAMLVTTGLPWSGGARAVALVGAVLAPVGFALTGHTRTMEPAVAAYVADATHLLAAAVWFGGLLALLRTIRDRRAGGDPLGAAEAVVGFSTVAAVSLGLVAVTGLTLGWVEVGGLDALTSTTYGRLLMAKVAAVVAIVALAGWNRFRLVPTVAAASLAAETETESETEVEGEVDGEVEGSDAGGASTPVLGAGDAAWQRLVRVVRAEVVLMVVVLGVTGVLVNQTPAKAAVAPGPLTVTAPLGEGTVEVTVDPAMPGRNDVHAYLYDAEGDPERRYEDATISLELPEAGIGPFELEPVVVAPGHFQLVAADFPLGGDWELTITVKPDRFTEQTATLGIPLR